ncbi:hypothetical protein [Phyllobacterium endophyticum]|uniref:Uncharacterized protein n=1 Tax=Phyllobacterium endophyticum TaxID=1149773 RepID=A0A2P7AP80_9HYPH|nr:hypothetical protein [Phyllobacterium endophyticum]MBB3233635.1 hypothetical protein [Phyllobacterium endophyticum]PSH56005.1 hypothetical protein CU100_20470 [Phyllobacterium endophyticum]TYR41153.1 hypothetical protein FY050_07480 [Phyllobacterium endophyticum]
MSQGLTAFANLINQPISPANWRFDCKGFKAFMGKEIGVIHALILAPLLKPTFVPCPIMNSLVQRYPKQRGSSRNFR